MKERYVIACGSSRAGLMSEVNPLVSLGYEPLGQPFSGPCGSMIYQALLLPDRAEVVTDRPIKINFNQCVRIKLKPWGEDIWLGHWRDVAKLAKVSVGSLPGSLAVSPNGALAIQLHVLMAVFGPHIGPCCDGCPFEMEGELLP